MMLESSCNKITVALGHAVVEWILILLLLLNSAFSYLIIKFAEFFGVERPCPWCTRLDHLHDHASHISKLGYCSNHRKLALFQDMCKCHQYHCLLQSEEFSNEKEKVVGEVIFKCCCGSRFDVDTTMYSSYLLLESWYDDVLKDWSASCNGNDRNLEEEIQEEESVSVSMSIDEMEEPEAGMDAKEDVRTDDNGREDQESVRSYTFTQDLPSTSSLNLDETDDHDENENENELEGGVTIESLKLALREERKCSRALYAELEEERSASAEAAIHAMAMINRLHEEKAAMQMEASQYRRMMEEQSEYDQQALQVMDDIMVELDKKNQEMEKKLLHHETMLANQN